MRGLVAGLVVMMMAGVALAGEPAGLKAVVVANKDKYVLDPAQSGKAFRDKLEEARKGMKEVPGKPPVVDLTLKITNESDKDVTVNIGGDESRVILKLAGPGAVTVPNLVAMTMEFRSGAPVTIGPGKSYEIAITSLMFGARGVSEAAFWTEPGEYTIAAELQAAQGEAMVRVVSEPVKVGVTK